MKFYQTEEEFLAGKQFMFGGSEVNTILGLSQYETPYKLYQNKLNGYLKDSNKFMDAGKMLENAIIERFYKSRSFEYKASNLGILSYSHPKYDFIVVHPDDIFNEVCLLEAKTSQKYLTAKMVTDYVKDLYFPQWNFTLGVLLENEPDTFSNHGFILMFSRGIDYFEIPLSFDKEFYEKCLAAVCAFRKRLEDKIPPELMAGDLDSFYKKSDGSTKQANDKDLDNHKNLVNINKRLNELENDKEELVSYFKGRMGESEKLLNPDNQYTLITWKSTTKGRTFKVYEN